MQESNAVDHNLLLEYLKVILSFPTVTLIIASVFLLLFKKELRLLFSRMRNFEAAGAKFGFEEVANVVVEKAVEVSTAIQKEAISILPEGDEKSAKAAALEQDIIALRGQLKTAIHTPIYGTVGFDKDIENYLNSFIRAQNIPPGYTLSSLPGDYFDRMHEGLVEAFPEKGFSRMNRATSKQILAGYWVRHQMEAGLSARAQ